MRTPCVLLACLLWTAGCQQSGNRGLTLSLSDLPEVKLAVGSVRLIDALGSLLGQDRMPSYRFALTDGKAIRVGPVPLVGNTVDGHCNVLVTEQVRDTALDHEAWEDGTEYRGTVTLGTSFGVLWGARRLQPPARTPVVLTCERGPDGNGRLKVIRPDPSVLAKT